MSAPLRFLALVAVGWVGLRALVPGMMPGAEAVALPEGKTLPPPLATEFPPLPPVRAEIDPMSAYYPAPTGYPAMIPAAAQLPAHHYYYVPMPAPRQLPAYGAASVLPAQYTPAAAAAPMQFYSPVPRLEEWPLSRAAAASYSPLPSIPTSVGAPQQLPASTSIPPRLDRVQLTMWALMRNRPGPGSLASGGQLGGSQAGARLSYALNRSIAVSLRSSSPLGGSRGGEVAGGIRVAPFRSIPIALTAERRQRIGRFSTGRSAFALFLEGGVYQRPMPWRFELDAYAQGGVVGIRSRDLFADGGFTLTRPLYGQFSVAGRPIFGQLSAGLGVWGGAQPGIYRVDAGPRLSLRVRPNVRVHLDWRQRLRGNADPASGPALTLAGDF